MRNKKLAIATLSIIAISVLSIASQAYAATPQFKITFIAPGGSSNPTRQQFARMIVEQLKSIGVDARVEYMPWSSLYDRALDPSIDPITGNRGKTYDDGGFDALFVGWIYTNPFVTDPKSVFYGTKENWAPSGQNYYLWINSTSNKYIDQFNAAVDEATKKAAIDKFQEVIYEEVPCFDVVNPREIVLAQKNLKYVDPIVFPYPEYFQGPDDSVTLVVPSEKTDLNPLLSTAWYDTVIWTPAFSSLVNFYPSFTANGEPKITQPDLTYVPNKVDLYAAESYTVSSDKLTWTFKLRDGLMFQDGVPVTADDVVFTYRSLLTPALASPAYGDYSTVFGSNESITALDSRTVQFKLPAPMPTFFAQYCEVGILPKHVLENVPYSEWRTHPFNTGEGTYTANGQTFSGPMGSGPYKFISYDPITFTATLERVSNYFFDSIAPQNGLQMGNIKTYRVRTISGGPEAAIAEMNSGAADIADMNFGFNKLLPTIAGLPSIKPYVWSSNSWQEVGFNMQHPIFGTGEEVPAVKAGKIDGYHAAKLLRKAITGMIPRQLIVDTLYGGVASPGIICFPPANVYFNLNLRAPAFDPVKAASALSKTGYAASIADIPPITVTPPSGTVSPTITVPGGTITGTTITASVTVPGGGTGTTLTSITVPTAGQITAPTAQSKTFSTGYESIMGNAYLGLGIGFVIGVIVFAVVLMRKKKTV